MQNKNKASRDLNKKNIFKTNPGFSFKAIPPNPPLMVTIRNVEQS